MDRVRKNVISSRRAKKASEALARDSKLISRGEIAKFGAGEMELIDRTVTLKTLITEGEEQDVLSKQKNKDQITGLNDFSEARIVSEDGGGSIAVDSIKLSHAIQETGQTIADTATKVFKQTRWPADLENGILQISQSGRVVQTIKISEFAFKGDEPQTRADQYKRLARPFTIAAGTDVKIRILRPGVVGKSHFFGIELCGMQVYPKRNRG